MILVPVWLTNRSLEIQKRVFPTYRVTTQHTLTSRLAETEKDHLSRYGIKIKRIVQAMFVPGKRLEDLYSEYPVGESV